MRPTILLVDDEEDILDLLARTLRGAGYEIDTASNGREGLQRLALRGYDLILTNLRMPVLDGEGFYRAICANHPRMAARVVFCTGDTANSMSHLFLYQTGAPIVFKPFHLATIIQVVAWKLQKEGSPTQPPAAPSFRPGAVLFPAF